MQPLLLYVGGGILGSKNFTITQEQMQELLSSGDPNYSFTLIDSAGNSKPLNFVDGIAVAPSEEGEYTLYASYTEYGTTYYSNGIPFIVKKPDPYWFYFGDTKTLVLKSGPDVPAGYGATVTESGKISYTTPGWQSYRKEILAVVITDEITAPFSMSSWFAGCSQLTSLVGFEKLDTSKVTDMNSLFYDCPSLSDISGLSNWNTSKVTSLSGIFYDCESLEDISALENWDIGSVTGMNGVFHGCILLSNIKPLTKWNTKKVLYMQYMFQNCESLEDISPISSWETGNVWDMSFMFDGCTSLEDVSDLANWDTSHVTNMISMFFNCKGITTWTSLDSWDVSKVSDHSGMFRNCTPPLPSWADASWQ